MRKVVNPEGAYGRREKFKGYRVVYTLLYLLIGNLPLLLICASQLVIF